MSLGVTQVLGGTRARNLDLTEVIQLIQLSVFSVAFSPPSFRLISHLAPKQLPNLCNFTGKSFCFCYLTELGSPYIPFIPHPHIRCSFLLLHLSSFRAAHLGCSCHSSLHLQISQGLVLHFCFLKSYDTHCLAYTVGVIPPCIYVQSFDHNGSCHLLYARLASDIKLGVLHASSLNLTTFWKKRSCVSNNPGVSWGLLVSGA